MKVIWTVFILLTLLVYEKLRRPIVCKKKIYAYINNIGGEVSNIEILTPRDEIYSVYYTLNGEIKHLNVKFNLFYKDTWC